jgi:hypothetical protein
MENLKGKLEQHSLWVKSGGKEGNKIDLSGANLRGIYLNRANLSGANLSGANLSGANLEGACLSCAYLSNVDLSKADLSGANLSNVDLNKADLSGANLSDVNLSGANLSSTDLTNVKGIATKEEEIKAAQKILHILDQPGNKLDMYAWHTCKTSHCIAGWLCMENENPGAEAARKAPTLAKYFFASNDEAYSALRRVASGEESIFNSLS